jgi:hypothetical protein
MSVTESIVERLRPLLGILGGALLGSVLFSVARGFLPPALSVVAVVVGLFAGVGARLVGAIGSPAQLRVLIFGTLVFTGIGEYVAWAGRYEQAGLGAWTVALLVDPVDLVLLLVFTTLGIFSGVRVLVGGDPLGDLAHALEAMPGGHTVRCEVCGAKGTTLETGWVCPECGHEQQPRARPQPSE